MRGLAGTLSALRDYIREHGLVATARRCLAEPFYRFEDWKFDTTHRVKTSGIVATADLDVAETDRALARRYQPVRLGAFAEFMRVLPIRHEEFTFIDVGCGKGRALLLASEFPFRRIVGVELSPELCRIAAANVRMYRSTTQKCKQIEILCENAAAYRIPAELAVLYFFNPFGEAVMEAILADLRNSLMVSPRPVYLVLYNPILDSLLRQADFLRLLKTTRRSSIYESGGPLRGADPPLDSQKSLPHRRG